jgi:peroxiredoxin
VTAKASDGGKQSSASSSAWPLRRLAPAALTALAIGFVGVRFVMGAHDTLARTRDGACQALAPDPLPAALRDKPTPDFQLPDANGQTVSLKAQVGHPVFLNFWATWCPPCVEEMPALEDLARRIDGTDMRLLAVSVDEDWPVVRRFFAKGSRMGVLLDTSKDVPKSFGTEKYPETFLIDAAGKVRYYFINKRDWTRPEAVACLESLR